MKRSGIIAVLLLSTAAGASMVGAYHHTDSYKAATTAHDFLDAYQRGDEVRAQKLLTRAAKDQKQVDGTMAAEPSARSTGTIKLGPVEIKQDVASVPVLEDGSGTPLTEKEVLKLRREDGEWRVFETDIHSDGIDLVINYEHPEQLTSSLLYALGKQVGQGVSGVANGLNQFARGLESGMHAGDHTVAPASNNK